MEEPVFECVRYSASCADRGARRECWGVHGLVGGSLWWDVESVCGQATAACGQGLPARLRDRLLADNGPTTLHVTAPSAVRVIVMRVLRADLGVGLTEAKAAADQVLAGAYSGTLPEVKYLARKLRAAGVHAVATRP